MDSNAASWAGSRLLNEIEETSLDEVLHALRKSIPATHTNEDTAPANVTASNKLQVFPVPVLNAILGRHFRATRETTLAVSGSYLPFLYALIATLILPPHNKAVVVIDTNGKFNPVGLGGCSPFSITDGDAPMQAADGRGPPPIASHPTARVRAPDLDHVHIYRPTWDANISIVMAEAEQFMLYSNHASKNREWWGTVVINEGPTFSGDTTVSSSTAALLSRPIVNAGYKGWICIEKEPATPPLNLSLPGEELAAELERYNGAVANTGWYAISDRGGFAFRLRPKRQ